MLLSAQGVQSPAALRLRRTLRCSQIVYGLQIQPELRGAAEVAREPHGGIANIRRPCIDPKEADPELIVDADAELYT
jgi:hypothetical protein